MLADNDNITAEEFDKLLDAANELKRQEIERIRRDVLAREQENERLTLLRDALAHELATARLQMEALETEIARLNPDV